MTKPTDQAKTIKKYKFLNPLGQAFIDFCESQGIEFVDIETGEPVKPIVGDPEGRTGGTKDGRK